MEKIKLNDILKLENFDNVKIRLNLSNSTFNSLKLFHEDAHKLLIGNFHNSTKMIWFKENQIVIGLAKIENNDWLLIDISRITKSYNKLWDGVSSPDINTFYEHEKLKEFEKYFGRVVVQFHKRNAFVAVTGKKMDDFILKEILPNPLDNDYFPGYDKVNISWVVLERVIEKDTWKTALNNQKGVYLLTDISNGMKYVGAAYGENMILERWKYYLKTVHGDNKKLKELPIEYIKNNFRFSILDIYKSETPFQIILDRENYWKDVLQSKKFGYNDN